MNSSHDFRYWNGELVVDTEERIPKVGDSVVMNSNMRGLVNRCEYIVKQVIGNYILIEGKPFQYPTYGLIKEASSSQIKKRNDATSAKPALNCKYGVLTCTDFDSNAIKIKPEPILLTQTPRTNSDIVSIETSKKYGYSEKEKKVVEKLTTTVVLKDGTKGSATCDAGEYDERTGVLNAIANAKCGGNFDSEYNKYCKNREKITKIKCKCGCCGKQYWTQEDAHECRKKHIANKIRKHENYLIRREAKRRLAEEVKENAIRTAMETIRKEEK